MMMMMIMMIVVIIVVNGDRKKRAYHMFGSFENLRRSFWFSPIIIINSIHNPFILNIQK